MMRQNEAREAILAEWLALPPVERQSEHQAASFAMKKLSQYQFRCIGDRYQRIKGWLLAHLADC